MFASLIQFLRHHVVAVLALCLAVGALGGAAYAAKKVGGGDLKKIKQRSATITLETPGPTNRIVTKQCRRGERALSTNADWSANGGVSISEIQTTPGGRGTRGSGLVVGRNEGGGSRDLTITVNCLRP